MTDILKILGSEMMLPSDSSVADFMTRDPIVVGPETSLKEAIKLMADHRVGSLPVVSDEKKLVGIISETDLMWQETGVQLPAYIMILDSVVYLENPATYDRELHKAFGQTVKDVMTTPVTTTSPEKSLRDAAKVMHKRKIHQLPVVDDANRVIGVLTLGDIVRFMATHYDS
ncbi:MAG: CBS domain-containing protein [Leptolyngbyaceae bacterium]|nr:CBS domain-containing protein [Leptolyngbyaceae bacterium]